MRVLLAIGVFLLLTLQVWGQGRQSITIAEGDTITLQAHAEGARSFIWFRHDEPILNQHSNVLRVSEAGIYTVVALGNSCDSDLSDPVEVLVGDTGPGLPEQKSVDLAIQNLPDRNVVLVGLPINYQIIAHNKSTTTATGVQVVVQLPREVIFDQLIGPFAGSARYNLSRHEITWDLDSVAGGQSASLPVIVYAADNGSAQQLSIVSSVEQEDYPADNRHLSTVEIIAIKIPNVFTPNGDGINDFFVIPGLELLQQCRLFIFNRDGHELYRNMNYQNNWDGRGLLPDVYFYILEVRFPSGKAHSFRGHVSIIK